MLNTDNKKSKYIMINTETLRIDLVKKDLSKDLVPFDIIDSVPNDNYEQLIDNIIEVIKSVKE